MTVEANPQEIDAGLFTLLLLLRLHGIETEVEKVRTLCGSVSVGVAAMLHCAGHLGLKARATTATWEQLSSVSMPVIAVVREGGFLLISTLSGFGRRLILGFTTAAE
jgi:subfamily B ATP-binding cassette protein HlyB/CyaB